MIFNLGKRVLQEALNPFYLSDNPPQKLKDWMTLVTKSVNNPHNINLQRPIIQKAAQLIDDDGLTPQERFGQIAEKQEMVRNLVSRRC